MSEITSFPAVADLGVTALTRKESRALIVGFENRMLQTEGAVVGDCFPLKHIFTPGVYVREITLPAGMVLTGKIHRERHFNFITRGHVQVFTEQGGMEEFIGPASMVSEPGTKRVVKVLEETVWTTIHHNPNNETDLDKIEAFVIAPSFEALEHKELQCLG